MSRIMGKHVVLLTAFLVAIGCAVAGQHATADTIAIQDWSGDMGTAEYGGVNLGYEFTTKRAIIVTKLGAFDYQANGLADSHPVGIWAVSDPSTPLASVTVSSGTSSPLEGALIGDSGFRYEELSSVLELSANTTYRIAAYYPTGADESMRSNAGKYIPGSPRQVNTTLASVLTYNFGDAGCYVYDDTGFTGLRYPSNGGPREFSYIGPNFQFVPEPGTLAHLLSGGLVALVVLVQRPRPAYPGGTP